MAYATTADATSLYGSDFVITSCDRNNDGTLDTGAFEVWLDAAADEIDGYLLGRYDLPLVNTPRTLIVMNVDIAIYRASGEAGPMTTIKTKRYEQAIKFLELVASGKIRLIRSGEASTGANKPNSSIVVIGRDQAADQPCGSREFTRDKLRGL